MASAQAISRPTTEQRPPVVRDLEAVFAALPDEELLDMLVGPTRRGPKGYDVRVLWHCFVAKYRMGMESTDAFIRALHDNPLLAEACGITDWPMGIPHKSTFSRFFAKIATSQYTLRVLKDVSRKMVRRHYDTLPGFGERVALDSSTLKGWVNGQKAKRVDPDAGWSIKKGTNGPKEFTFGYKLHLLVDCEYELPIAAKVTAGNVHDAAVATNVLSEARTVKPGFHAKYLMADAGYSGREFFVTVRRQYRARPIIDVNPSHKKILGEAYQGNFYRTPEWEALYRQRPAVERVFSRLKGQRSLNHITVRRWRKVTAHCYMSLIAMQAGCNKRD